MLALPPVHIGRPYQRPTVAVQQKLRVTLADGAELACWIYGTGAGPAVLFIHGNGEEHGIFGPSIDALVASGCVVYAFDSRGQGQSTRGQEPLSYELLCEDTLAVLKAFGQQAVHVVGFSDGAIIGLLLARDYPHTVQSLLAIGANLVPESIGALERAGLAAAVKALRAWSRCGRAGVINEEGHEVPDPPRAAIQADLLQLMLDHPHIDAASLSSIRIPCIIMAGEDDDLAQEDNHAIVAAIEGAELRIVPGVDHNVPKMAPDQLTLAARELIGRFTHATADATPQGDIEKPQDT